VLKQIFSYIKINRWIMLYYLGEVPFADIVALYQKARFFITAVLYDPLAYHFKAAAAWLPNHASDTPPNFEMAQI